MDLKIGAITVTVEGEFDENGDVLVSEIERCLRHAFDNLSMEPACAGYIGDEVPKLELPPIDWSAETDRTGKIVELLKRALTEAGA